MRRSRCNLRLLAAALQYRASVSLTLRTLQATTEDWIRLYVPILRSTQATG